MSVIRRKNGSLEIRGKNGGASVTMVGAMRKISEVDQTAYRQWLEECARLVVPCARTDRETEEYFLTLCDTEPIPRDDRELIDFKCNLLWNRFADRMTHQPGRPSPEMSDGELEHWQEEEDALRAELAGTPPERFGLVIRGYRLPHTERNEVFYAEARAQFEGWRKAPRPGEAHLIFPEIEFFFEESTGSCSANGGGGSIMEQIALFRGVSAEDIETRGPRFQGYAHELSRQGKLPPRPPAKPV